MLNISTSEFDTGVPVMAVTYGTLDPGIEQPARLDEQIERLGRNLLGLPMPGLRSMVELWVGFLNLHLVQNLGINAQLVKRHHLVAYRWQTSLSLHLASVGRIFSMSLMMLRSHGLFISCFGNFVNLLQYRLLCFLWSPGLSWSDQSPRHPSPQ